MSSRTSPRAAAARSRAPRSSTSSSATATGCRRRSSAGICSATSRSSGSTRATTRWRRCRSATPSTVVVGTPVAAIGSPFGEQSSLSVGVVSATDRTIDSLTSGYSVADAIQIDAPINRGNSGGPLFDASGPRDRDQRPDPLDERQRRGRRLRDPDRHGQARARPAAADGQGRVRLRRRHDAGRDARASRSSSASTSPHGALIAKVEPGTPAARAGLHGGTRTVDYNGLEVSLGGDVIVEHRRHARSTSADDVSRAVSQARRRPAVPFTVLRGGTDRRASKVTLAERPA